MRLLFHVCAWLALCLTGCGGGDGTIAVTGTVQLDGKPLEGAAVTFHPLEGTKGPGGAGSTDGSGKFFVVNPQGKKGMLAGNYKVTVSKTHLKKPVEDKQKYVLIESDLIETLPAIYSNLEKTVLTATVGQDGKPVDLKLETTK